MASRSRWRAASANTSVRSCNPEAGRLEPGGVNARHRAVPETRRAAEFVLNGADCLAPKVTQAFLPVPSSERHSGTPRGRGNPHGVTPRIRTAVIPLESVAQRDWFAAAGRRISQRRLCGAKHVAQALRRIAWARYCIGPSERWHRAAGVQTRLFRIPGMTPCQPPFSPERSGGCTERGDRAGRRRTADGVTPVAEGVPCAR